MLKELLGIGATIERVEKPAVIELVGELHIAHGLVPLVGAIDWDQAEGDADFPTGRQMTPNPRHG